MYPLCLLRAVGRYMVLRRIDSFSILRDYTLCRRRLFGGDMCCEAMSCLADLDRSIHGLAQLLRGEDSVTITVNALLVGMRMRTYIAECLASIKPHHHSLRIITHRESMSRLTKPHIQSWQRANRISRVYRLNE